MAEEWFETWFDTNYYHLLYRHRDMNEARQFLDALLRYLKPEKATHFLDVACGKGRHSIYLHSQGYQVTGVDLSCNSIEKARLAEDSGLNFYVKDIREDFGIHGIDIALNMFTSFGYFETLEEHIDALKNIRNTLNESGLFVFDYLNVDHVAKHLIDEERKTIDGVEFKIQRKIEGGFILKNIDVDDQGEIHHFQEKVKAFKPEDLMDMISKAGFKIDTTFGDYNLNPLDSGRPRVIIIATKN